MPLVIGEAILNEYVGPSRRVDAPKILAHTVRTRRRHECLSAAPLRLESNGPSRIPAD